MKVVLKQDVKNIGKKDELHEVSDGYARNYLMPRGLAVPADASAVNEVKSKQEAQQHREQQELDAARALAATLQGITLEIVAKGGQSGRLFGAITVKDIAKKLSGRNINIDKRKLVLDVREIKNYGSYEVEAKIMPGVSAKFTCKVIEE